MIWLYIFLAIYSVSLFVSLIRTYIFAKDYAPFTLEELVLMSYNIIVPIRNTWFAFKKQE